MCCIITTAGNLPAKFVIHTVGPVWNGGAYHEEALLSAAYSNCLKLSVANKVQSIAFPNISTGIYHFPKEKAAIIAVETVKDFLNTNNIISRVIFVCFDNENYVIYKRLI